MQIRVPASSANLGPGFDSIGLAVNCYLELTVLEPAGEWFVDHDLLGLSHGASNLIVKAALAQVPDLAPHHLLMRSAIPVTHGLGSSSAAIVAGIELANQLAGLHLTKEEKVQRAAALEGHPDNVAPAIYGGLVVGTRLEDEFVVLPAPLPPVKLVAYVPPYSLQTAAARAALPNQLAFKEAVAASAVANTLVAALYSKRLDLVGKLLEADRFHEAARTSLVPELPRVRAVAHQVGAVATYLSGAGPTIMTLIKPARIPAFKNALQEAGLTAPLLELTVDRQGVTVSD